MFGYFISRVGTFATDFLSRRFHRGVRQVCRWIFHAASGFCDHSSSHLLFSQVIRNANVADEPAYRLGETGEHVLDDIFSSVRIARH